MGDAVDFVGHQVDASAGFEQGERGLIVEAVGRLIEPAAKGGQRAEHLFSLPGQGQQLQNLLAGGGAEALFAFAVGAQGFGGGVQEVGQLVSAQFQQGGDVEGGFGGYAGAGFHHEGEGVGHGGLQTQQSGRVNGGGRCSERGHIFERLFFPKDEKYFRTNGKIFPFVPTGSASDYGKSPASRLSEGRA